MYKITDHMKVSICQAVALLYASEEVSVCPKGREARDILRKALSDYADYYMDQAVDDKDRAKVAIKHQRSASTKRKKTCSG